MRLGTKGQYAVMAMADLALHQDHGYVTLPEISERQHIPLAYLEQLFIKLRRCHLVESTRGPGGGYRLNQSPENITIAHVIQAVDEKIQTTRCNRSTTPHHQELSCRGNSTRCLTHDLWDALGQKIHDYLESVTLADVCQKRIKSKNWTLGTETSPAGGTPHPPSIPTVV